MDRPGSTIERVGGYRVIRRLATGGTADVLLAKAEGPHGFERTVVLKLLLSQFKDDEDLARMFAREASAYARLSHPSIVKLYDFFATDGQLVMVLEYVDGPPLNRLRGMLKAIGQPLDDQASIHVAMRIFSALASAHAATDDSGAPAPVIHRDVNPSNVLIPWDGHVKIADFGVAKVAGLTGESRVGMLKGTFGYMAPEQVTGEPPVSPRADVYAGAVILWELLTRRRAFQRGALPEIEVLRQMAEPKIVPIDVLRPDVDRSVRDAIRRALEPDANKRRITAEEMVAILRAAVPIEVGREHLSRALEAVRHEPRPSWTSYPPPAERDPITLTGARPPSAAGSPSRASAPPRAEIALRRSVGTPAPGAVTPVAGAVADRISEAPSTEPSAPAPGVAVAPAPAPSSPSSPGNLDAVAPGKEVRAAIEDILREIPSSIPPDTFRGRSLQPARGEDPTVAAIPPMRAVVVPEEQPASEAEAMDHTMAMPGAPPVPPPQAVPPPPARLLALADPFAREAPVQTQRTGEVTFSTKASEPPPPLALSFPPAVKTLSFGSDPAAQPVSLSSSPPPAPQPSRPPTVPPPDGPPMPVMPMPASTLPLLPDANARPASMAPPAYPQASNSSLGAASLAGPYEDAEPPRRRSVVLMAMMALGLVTLVGGGGAVGYMRWQSTAGASALGAASSAPARASASAAGTARATAAAAATASASAPASATASAHASASASAPAPAPAPAPKPAPASDVPPGMGIVQTAGAPVGRRIYVDGVVVGQTPDEVKVKCGLHNVKVGSSGKARPLQVPCGASVSIFQ